MSVHEQLETYLPELQKSLKKLTKEELIKKVFSEVFNRLQTYYHEGNSGRLNSMADDTPKSFKPQNEVRFLSIWEKETDWIGVH